MEIENLIHQHQHILGLVDAVAGLRPEKDAPAIAAELSKLKTAIGSHLAVEDQHLYPALRTFGDRPEAPVALKVSIKNFFNEMETLKPVAEGFLNKWTAEAIANAPAAFRDEFGAISDTLAQRIAREETRLYPLYVEHVLGAVSR